MILVKPLDTLPTNLLAFEDKQRSVINGALLKFNKRHPYIRDCLIEIGNTYFSNGVEKWTAIGPSLLTKIWKRSYANSNTSTSGITVLDYRSFYMFQLHKLEAQTECFKDTQGTRFIENNKILQEDAYAVHLNNKNTADKMINGTLKNGTLCKHILNNFCVLCNKMY